jgi:pimeloyl-ACP methyl ester carboxylesterase
MSRVSLLLVGGLAAVAALSATYNLAVPAVLQHRYPPPGAIYKVNGYAMHLYCTGAGAPTVIVEAGLGDDFIGWQKVQPEVAKFTRICTYDRAGLGWSDDRPEPHDAKHIAQQLHALLQAAGENGPIVLVGASAGGYYARQFVSDFPQLVAGIVFSDSSVPDQVRDIPGGAWTPEEARQAHHDAMWDLINQSTGWARLRGQCQGEVEKGLDTWRDVARAEACRPAYARSGLAEWDEFWHSADEAAEARCCGNIPLLIVSRDPDWRKPGWDARAIAAQPIWNKLQESLKALSPQSRRIIARGSGHHVHIDRPDVVVAAIRQVVNDVRQHKPDPQVGTTVMQIGRNASGRRHRKRAGTYGAGLRGSRGCHRSS